MKRQDVRDYIIFWNLRFPVDRWWRKKYNIAFNSSGHRESCFIDQLIEFEEEKVFREIENPVEYIPGTGDWLVRRQPSSIEESIKSLREEFQDIE